MDITFSIPALDIITRSQIDSLLMLKGKYADAYNINAYVAFELPAGYIGFTMEGPRGVVMLTGGIDSDGVVST